MYVKYRSTKYIKKCIKYRSTKFIKMHVKYRSTKYIKKYIKYRSTKFIKNYHGTRPGYASSGFISFIKSTLLHRINISPMLSSVLFPSLEPISTVSSNWRFI